MALRVWEGGENVRERVRGVKEVQRHVNNVLEDDYNVDLEGVVGRKQCRVEIVVPSE